MSTPTPIRAWQCIGCGRLDAPQPCVGVCEDRPVELVPLAEYQRLQAQADAMHALLAQVIATQPRAGAWEASYRAFQGRAQALLAR